MVSEQALGRDATRTSQEGVGPGLRPESGVARGLEPPQDSPSTCWHGPCRPFPQSPRGRHSLASRLAFSSAISPAAFPAGKKSDTTTPAAATPCALGHPGLRTLSPRIYRNPRKPRTLSCLRSPPYTPYSASAPLTINRGARAAETGRQLLRWPQGAGRTLHPPLSRGLRRTKTKETSASQRPVRREDQPLHFCGPPSLP